MHTILFVDVRWISEWVKGQLLWSRPPHTHTTPVDQVKARFYLKSHPCSGLFLLLTYFFFTNLCEVHPQQNTGLLIPNCTILGNPTLTGRYECKGIWLNQIKESSIRQSWKEVCRCFCMESRDTSSTMRSTVFFK